MPSWGWWVVGLTAALAVLVALLPWVIQAIVRAILWPRYALEVRGGEHVPRRGPALIVVNHVSWIDGFVLAAAVPRLGGKALASASYIDVPIFRQLARRAGIIPVPWKGPRAHRAAIEAVRAAFDRGECVGIFPEAQLSRNGMLGPFHRGLEVMLRGRDDVPVIPMYLDNLWGSVFSFSGGRFLGKRPRGWRRRVVVAFGSPVEPPVTAFAARQAVQAASVLARRGSSSTRPSLPETIDPNLPRWEHPELGWLTASTPDYHVGDVHQTGQKPGSLGQAVPGVAIRAVGADGRPLPADQVGRLQALVPSRADWIDLGRDGHLDREGFVYLDQPG